MNNAVLSLGYGQVRFKKRSHKTFLQFSFKLNYHVFLHAMKSMCFYTIPTCFVHPSTHTTSCFNTKHKYTVGCFKAVSTAPKSVYGFSQE